MKLTGPLKFLIAAMVTLVGTEVGVRLVLPRPGFVPFPVAEVEGVFRPDSARGYAYSPHVQRHIVTPNYTIDFETNGLGMRDTPADEPPAPGTFRILAVGDSFTQGHGVAADQAWPRRLEALLAGSRVYNAGVSGYSLTQMNETARELIPRLRPNLLALGLYVSSYYRIHDPFVLVGDGAGLVSRSQAQDVAVTKNGYLVSRHGRSALRHLERFLDRYWYTGAYFLQLAARARGAMSDHSRPASETASLNEKMAPMLQELLTSQALADSVGIPMVVLLINPQSRDGSFSDLEHEYNTIVSGFAAAHGIRVVDPLPRLVSLAGGRSVFRLNKDLHWSAAAHAVAAEELAKAIDTHPEQ